MRSLKTKLCLLFACLYPGTLCRVAVLLGTLTFSFFCFLVFKMTSDSYCSRECKVQARKESVGIFSPPVCVLISLFSLVPSAVPFCFGTGDGCALFHPGVSQPALHWDAHGPGKALCSGHTVTELFYSIPLSVKLFAYVQWTLKL